MRSLAAIIAVILALTLSGCTKPEDNNVTPNENNVENNGQNSQLQQEQNNPDENELNTAPQETRVEGTITEVTKNAEGLVNFTVRTTDEKEYILNVHNDFNETPHLGDTVSVSVEGEISETSPYQATATGIDVTKEFAGVPQDIQVYHVSDIASTQLENSFGSAGWIFKQFNDYEECQAYLDQNQLNDKLNNTVGDMDITNLTDEFFTNNKLYLFISGKNTVDEPAANEVSLMDNVLYLKVTETSTESTLNNTSYKAYLIPMSKDTEVSDGIMLYERILTNNLSENEAEENNPFEENTTQNEDQTTAEQNSNSEQNANNNQNGSENP